MRFFFRGSEYSIEFARKTRDVTVQSTGKIVKSRFPYTTVNILKLEPGPTGLRTWTIVRSATVGTFSTDTFTHEGGRLNALRNISRSMTNEKEFKKAIWAAYTKRRATKKS